MLDWNGFKNTLQHNQVAVFGLGKSGLSTIKALVENEITVVAWDDDPEKQEQANKLGADIKDLTKIGLSNFDYLILSPGVPYTFNPHPVVDNAHQYECAIIGDVELLHLLKIPTQTIGITGTNGKSTSTALMTHILNECGLKAKEAGNIGIPVLDLEWKDKLDFLVLELSSYQLDLTPSFRPDYSILLNISPDHLDRHGSMKAYVESKSIILDGTGVGVVDIDDDFAQVLFDKFFLEGKRKYIPVSVFHEVPEGFFVKNDNLYQNHLGENQELANLSDLPSLKGHHNYQNIVCCIVTGLQIGLDLNQMVEALKTFPGLPHRQFVVSSQSQITFINDSKATNAEAAAKALSSYENIYWIAGGRAKENGLQGLEIFKDKVIKTFLIGEAEENFAQFLLKNNFEVMICHDLENATKQAYESAKNDNNPSTILLSPACASWDQFSSFEERGDAFTSYVQELVKV
ncbi:MAG: UDP-N-acetylmuramoyl-L-alanine--D-glutamate ligase [Pseudomonadota bacterium]